MSLLRLVNRNLLRHPVRTLLTIGSLVVAFFLLCTLRSLVTTLSAGVEVASAQRLIVQSAVSLFVDLPLYYQAKIAQAPGVGNTCKWQWFGGIYKDRSNYFGQFACDPENLLEMYPEFAIVDGSREGFLGNRRGCFIGTGLRDRFNWKVGDTVPLIGTFYPHPDGADTPWEFQVEAIYEPTKKQMDSSTMFFHWDYFEKTLEASDTGLPGMGMVVIELAPGAEPTQVMASVDGMFDNGPLVVQTTSEDEFNAQFTSMLGNVPFFLSSIGGAILVSILLACINAMLMAAREQTRDIGIMKALGFTDTKMSTLLIAQGLLLCSLGGAIGVGIAKFLERPISEFLGPMFPGYFVKSETVIIGLVTAIVLGIVAGLIPAWYANRLRPVQAFRTAE